MLNPETFNGLLNLKDDATELKKEVFDLENSYNIFYDMDEWKEEIESKGYSQLIEESVTLLHLITQVREDDTIKEEDVFASAFRADNASLRNKLAWFIKSLGKAQKQATEITLLTFPLLEDVFSGVIKTDDNTLTIYRDKIQKANYTYLTEAEYSCYLDLFKKDIKDQYYDYEIEAVRMTSKSLVEQLNLLLEELKEEAPALGKAILAMARDISKAIRPLEKKERLLNRFYGDN